MGLEQKAEVGLGQGQIRWGSVKGAQVGEE